MVTAALPWHRCMGLHTCIADSHLCSPGWEPGVHLGGNEHQTRICVLAPTQVCVCECWHTPVTVYNCISVITVASLADCGRSSVEFQVTLNTVELEPL